MTDDITQSTPGSDTTQTDIDNHMIPKYRLDEVRRARDEALAEVAKMKAAEEKRKQKAAEEAGEYQKLFEDLRPKAQRLDELESLLQGMLVQELESLPEASRASANEVIELIPSVEGKLAALRRLAQVMTPARPTPAPLDTGKGGGPKLGGLSASEIDIAAMFGMTPERYAELKGK